MIREMNISDYDNIIILWRNTPGICLRSDDSKEKVEMFLTNNKGLSFIAVKDDNVVGTILCGTDSKRGFLYHLVVDEVYRRQGIGEMLVKRCLSELNKIGISKCHIFLMSDNELGENFWNALGWEKRNDIFVFSANT